MSKPTASAFSRLITRTMSILRGRRGDEYTVSVHLNGIDLKWVTLDGKFGERNIRWEEILSVIAFKRDLVTSDMICILCTFYDGVQFEFNEEMPCWESLVEALHEHLPGCPAFPEWGRQVSVPAFVTNERVLFHRGGNDKPSIPGSSD